MPTIHQLHHLYLQQLESVIKESELLLQKEGGLDGELKTSGSMCERFIKATLESLCIPGQFRVVSGYIATPTLLRDGKNLPQCDLIIVDKHIPPLFKFVNSDMEVVPRESVCGLIEIKRSLTKESLDQALAQLNKIASTLGEADTVKMDWALNAFNRHAGFHNYSSNKPLIGVIALKNKCDKLVDFKSEVPKQVSEAESLVDFVWTLDGYAILPSITTGDQLLYYAHTARPKSTTWSKLTQADFKNAESEYYRNYDGNPVWAYLVPESENEKVKNFSIMVGMISIWLSRIFGKTLQEDSINEYYFRHY